MCIMRIYEFNLGECLLYTLQKICLELLLLCVYGRRKFLHDQQCMGWADQVRRQAFLCGESNKNQREVAVDSGSNSRFSLDGIILTWMKNRRNEETNKYSRTRQYKHIYELSKATTTTTTKKGVAIVKKSNQSGHLQLTYIFTYFLLFLLLILIRWSLHIDIWISCWRASSKEKLLKISSLVSQALHPIFVDNALFYFVRLSDEHLV